MGAAGACKNAPGDPRTSGHEEGGKPVWVLQAGGGGTNLAETATAGGQAEEETAGGSRGESKGRGYGLGGGSCTGKEMGASGTEGGGGRA